MRKQLKEVEKFHQVFEHPVGTSPNSGTYDRINLRFNLMDEENKEYLKAAKENNLIEVGDALGDMLYILCGTIIEHGMQDRIEEVFDAIQISNMSKLGEDGKPIYREDGKILKGPNYFKPTKDIERVLLETKEDKITSILTWIDTLSLDELIYSESFDRRMEDMTPDLHESETFSGNVEELLGVPWSTVTEHMVEILDLQDTFWYQFINHYLIKREVEAITIFKIRKR